MNDIFIFLLRLGIPPNSCGFLQTAYAISLSIEEPDRLQLITKCLYPDVARHFHTSAACVEHNIRTAIDAAWKHNPNLLWQISYGFLSSRPTTSEFLSVAVLYFLTK